MASNSLLQLDQAFSGSAQVHVDAIDDATTEVAKALEEDILFGKLAPGARLIEDNLIARFGVTRHFIRQALYQLERTGIVVREKNKGVTVRYLTPLEVQQIYEVRELLHRQAALRIALPASPILIRELEDIYSEYEQHVATGFWRGVHEANDRFHLKLFSACDNPYLVESIKHYMWLSLPIRAKTTADISAVTASLKEHFMMIQLLKGTDVWALAQLCVEHVQPAKNHYLAQVENT